MSTELICPDCGGVIGGDGAGDRPACQCESSLTMDDTEVEAQPAPAAALADAPAAPPVQKKICCKCGKDVTHLKRAKDVRGYWCWECHRNDLRNERAGQKPRARCPQCGRLVPAESIKSYHGATMCAKCIIEQEELPNHQKLKFKNRPDDQLAKEHEKRGIIILSVIFGLLAIIILLHLVHLL